MHFCPECGYEWGHAEDCSNRPRKVEIDTCDAYEKERCNDK